MNIPLQSEENPDLGLSNVHLYIYELFDVESKIRQKELKVFLNETEDKPGFNIDQRYVISEINQFK